MSQFGPAYEASVDRDRLKRQMEVIRDVMLSANQCSTWLTLKEIEAVTGLWSGFNQRATQTLQKASIWWVHPREAAPRKNQVWALGV